MVQGDTEGSTRDSTRGLCWREKNGGSQNKNDEFWEYGKNAAVSEFTRKNYLGRIK